MDFFARHCTKNAFFFPALLFFLFPHTVSAIQISPMRETVVIDPGGTEAVSVSIKNDTRVAATVHTAVDAFMIDEKNGRALFGAKDEAIGWVQPDTSDVVLKPNEERDILFRIHVPKGAQPSGHYLGLFAEERPPQGAIGIGTRVGALLFLYVGGAVQESVMLRSLVSDQPIYVNTPASVSLILENIGGIHVIPQGMVSVQNTYGETTDRFMINAGQRKILPGGLWREVYAVTHLTNRDVGRLMVVANVQYGATAKHLFDATTFWYVPFPIIGIAVILFVLFMVIVLALKKREKHLRRKRL